MIIIGSRGSALALAQTGWVKDQILRRFPNAEIRINVIKTSADKDPTASIRSASSVGVFVKELEQALIGKEIDIAVHSMKDLPTSIPDGLRIAAVPEREDARDAFIADKVASLIGTAGRIARGHRKHPQAGSITGFSARPESPGNPGQCGHTPQKIAGWSL